MESEVPMFNAHRYLTGGLLAMTLALVAPACASTYPVYRYPAGVGNVDERAYNRGYEEGRSRGETDARRNRSYDYDRHVGGAIYLFLRGHAAPGGGLHREKPPRALMDALDRLFSGAEVPA